MTNDQLQMTNVVEDDLLWERWRCEVDKGQSKERIDKYLAVHMTNTSRNRIQTAADAGNVWVNGQPVASNYRVKPGDVIQVLLDHEPHDYTITPENIPLDIVYEDADLLVVNKPAGLVVHPGHGNYEHTLLHGLAWHFEQQSIIDNRKSKWNICNNICPLPIGANWGARLCMRWERRSSGASWR